MRRRNITAVMIKNFKKYLYEEERSENTVQKYIRDVKAFYKCVDEVDLKKRDVLEYKKLLCKKYAPKSVNSMLSSLNAMFVFMERYDLKVRTLKIQQRTFTDNGKGRKNFLKFSKSFLKDIDKLVFIDIIIYIKFE